MCSPLRQIFADSEAETRSLNWNQERDRDNSCSKDPYLRAPSGKRYFSIFGRSLAFWVYHESLGGNFDSVI